MPLPPRQLSRELRLTTSPDLRRRRWILGLTFVGLAMGKIVSLYHMGVLRRLPDIPLWPFDATRVDAAPYAYKQLQTPDGVLMIGTYAVTALVAAGGRDRAERNPALPLLLAAKTGYDSYTNLKLAREEWHDTRALCGYCQTASVASLVSFALALPEAWHAIRGGRR